MFQYCLKMHAYVGNLEYDWMILYSINMALYIKLPTIQRSLSDAKHKHVIGFQLTRNKKDKSNPVEKHSKRRVLFDYCDQWSILTDGIINYWHRIMWLSSKPQFDICRHFWQLGSFKLPRVQTGHGKFAYSATIFCFDSLVIKLLLDYLLYHKIVLKFISKIEIRFYSIRFHIDLSILLTLHTGNFLNDWESPL